MADIENTPVEQLCYTWSDVGLSTVYAGFRIRAASPGLTEIYSERVKSMDRYMRYVLPPGTDRFAITPDMAPVCLAFVRTEWGEYILVHKNYVGEDGVGRLGNFFIHLFALGRTSCDFSAWNAVCFWKSTIWKTSDTQLDRRSNVLETIPIKKLYDAQSLRFNYAQVQRDLPFFIEAYLLRQHQQPIYVAAPSSSVEMIVSLIAGLTDCLPQRLLADLTFSTYEPDVTKAAAQIVGTSWVATAGKEDSGAQVFASQFYREKLAINCYTGEQSPLKGHPLTTNNPVLATLAPQFAQFATECLVADEMEPLYDLIEQAEKDPNLTIESFLRLYSSEIVHKGHFPPEVIESHLASAVRAVEKLNDKEFRQSIINALLSNPQWWGRLRPLLLNLRKQGRELSQRTDAEQDQKRRASGQGSRRGGRSKSVTSQKKPSLTLVDALSRLADNAIAEVVSAMEKKASWGEGIAGQNAAYEVVGRKGDERVTILLEMMSCSLLEEDSNGVWKKLLDSILGRPNAHSFLTIDWDIFSWLLKQWDVAFPIHSEYDKEVSRLFVVPGSRLVVPWFHLGEFLELKLRERHSEWNIFAVDELTRGDSLTPQIAQYLGQNYGEEITELLSQLVQEQRWWVRAAQFVTKLSNNDYPGKAKYYNLIEQLLGFLIKIPQSRLLAKDVVVALTLSGYSGTASYLRLMETFLEDLLKNGQQEQKEGMDLFNTLVKVYDKERFAPIVLQANLGLVKQVYPTQEEQALFFASKGSQYLSTAEHLQIMSNLYSELLNYPAKPQRLLILLGASTEENYVLTVLNKGSLEWDELVSVLEHYGKQYLKDYQRSPRLAQYIVDAFGQIAQGEPSVKQLLFALFTSSTSHKHLEALLTYAHLSVEESIEFFQTYGSAERYFPFFFQSPATLTLLTNLAQYINTISATSLSAMKMQVILSWLAPAKLQLVLSPNYAGRILQAAALTSAEQTQFLERYGQTYLPLYRQLPIILEYLAQYVSTFTTDTLDRVEAKRFMAFLWQGARSLPLDSPAQQRLHNWEIINRYLEAPTVDPRVLNGVATALFELDLPNTSAFEGKLAAAFARSVEHTDNLGATVQHVVQMQYVRRPKLKSNWIQLLYSIAEECAGLYGRQERVLLPCLLFVLSIDINTILDSNTIPDMEKRQQHFTQQLLDRLLRNTNDLAIWRNLDRYVKNQFLPEAPLKQLALKRWNTYLHNLKLSDKIIPDQYTEHETAAPPVQPYVKISPSTSSAPASPTAAVTRLPTSSPSWRERLKSWWDYEIATIRMGGFKNVARLAKTWEQYKTLLSPEDFSQEEWEKIDVAYTFVEICNAADKTQPFSLTYEDKILQLNKRIKELSLKYTRDQEDRIALAQQRLQAGVNSPPRGSSGSLPGGQVLPTPHIQNTRPAKNPRYTLQKQREEIQVHLDVKPKKTKRWWPWS